MGRKGRSAGADDAAARRAGALSRQRFASFGILVRLLVMERASSPPPAADVALLWDRFHREMLAFARARVESEADARDVLQDVFVRAQNHWAAGEAPESPRAWLYQVLRNLVVDAHRHARKWRGLELVHAEAEVAAPSEDSVAESSASATVARLLPRFIGALDGHYRDALTMVELEGLTQVEAAKRAGISVSGMKSRVQRGRKQLFDALLQCCQFDFDVRGGMIACRDQDGRDCCE